MWSRGASLDRLLAKVNPDGSITRYIYGSGLLYEETTLANGTVQSLVYYHFDWRGDTIALSDPSGTVTVRMNYSPYGERTIELVNGIARTVRTPFCFNGKWGVMTEPTGLLSMQARFYSPVLRRFLNEDPSGFEGGINLYAYANGDPIDLIDPFGLGPQPSWAQRGWGLLRLAGGALEATAGGIAAVAGFGSTVVDGPVGVGVGVFGVSVAGHGIDQTQAGFRQMISGIPTDSLTAIGLQKAGLSPTAAHVVDGVASIVGTGGANLAAAKTISTVYHFTTAENAASIATQGFKSGGGIFGRGVYVSGVNSPAAATIMGAASTEAVIKISAESLKLTPTLIPGAFKLIP